MAARVLLLGILFTEVLEPICTAGTKGTGNNFNGKNGSKGDLFDGVSTKLSSSTLRIEPSGVVVLGKHGITLNCISGNNKNITWLYNEQPAPPCGIAKCKLLEDRSLYFPEKQVFKLIQKGKNWNNTILKWPDKHEYRCIEKTNMGYLRSSPTFIKIAQIPHRFKQSPIDLTVREGEIARFSCSVDMVPETPSVIWQFNEKILTIDRKNTKFFMVPPGVLFITAAEKSDEGSYRCIVTNSFVRGRKHLASMAANLTVTSRLKSKESEISSSSLSTSSSLYPQISYNYSLVRGERLSLACAAASGDPAPTVTWTFFPKYPDATQSRTLLNSTSGISILSLNDVSNSDAGTYQCSMKNVVSGETEKQNITVKISVLPSFIKKPLNLNCPNGRTARFECQVQGTPMPQIYWLKDSENISVNGRLTTYLKENNTMQLAISATVPSDSGMYQCIAVNSAGEIWAGGWLRVNASRNSPAVPTLLKCEAISPVKIVISWLPPKSLSPTSITAYTVHYSPEEGGQEEVAPEPGNSTSVEVTKLLEPYTNYSFYVRVWNNHGASDQSATIICATPPSVPKAAPKVHVDVLSSTKLNVNWQSLTKKEARGVIVEYKIQSKLHALPLKDITVPATFENYIITNLLPGAQYDLRVLARTEQGWPNISESQMQWTNVVMPSVDPDELKIKDVVDLQIKILNTSILRMEWKSKNDEIDYMGIKFESWKINCNNINDNKLSSVILPKNASEYLFTDLASNISYTLGLCIVKDGSSNDCVSKTIKSILPNTDNIPTALEAIPLSPTSIKITWTMINKILPCNFTICYQPVKSELLDPPICIIKNETIATISYLTPFTLYQFKVRSFQNDSNKSSEFSNSIECYTSEDLPEAPEDIQGIIIGTKLRLTWREPSKQNGIIQNYSISYTMDFNDPSIQLNMTVAGDKTTAVLSDLIVDKRYFVIIRAATRAGYGRSSYPFSIIMNNGLSKDPTSSDKQQPSAKPQSDQSLGVILGVGISIGFIAVSLCSIYCRKKWEDSRSMRDTSQPLKKRSIGRNGNTCCVDDSSTSIGQSVNNPTIHSNEFELAVLCPSSPVSTILHSNAKTKLPNGVEGCPSQPLLISWKVNNGETEDLVARNNSQYKQKGSPVPGMQSESDLNVTELTMIDCTLTSADNSLNNNFACSTSSPKKIVPVSIPVLEPNG